MKKELRMIHPKSIRPRCINRVSVIGCVMVLSVLVAACGGRKKADDGTISNYRADFRSDKELAFWRCYDQGKWEVRDGWLVADARGTSPSRTILWLTFPLPESVTIEFEGECLDRPGELGCFLYGDGRTYSGYEISVGGDNKRLGIYKSAKDGDEKTHKRLGRDTIQLVKDRSYAIKIKKYRGSIRLYVNDDLLLQASDQQPITAPDHRFFGLSTVGNLVRFNNLKIEAKR